MLNVVILWKGGDKKLINGSFQTQDCKNYRNRNNKGIKHHIYIASRISHKKKHVWEFGKEDFGCSREKCKRWAFIKCFGIDGKQIM